MLTLIQCLVIRKIFVRSLDMGETFILDILLFVIL